nr:phosphatidate cytidylyltransferase [uncultured Sphingomonas sp.]
MSELVTRSVVGLVLIVAALGVSFIGGMPFALTIALVATIMYLEWARIVRGWSSLWMVGGFFYCLFPAVSLIAIRVLGQRLGVGDGFFVLIWAFLVTWSTDIGAYFTGRAVGGPKLAPSISPNKTISGLVGGVVSAAAIAGSWAHIVGLPSAFLWMAAPFAVIAQMGDLFESWMKRRAGVKDSGTWLPGHGGLLDRLDGLVPVAVLTLALMVSVAP